MTRIRLALLRLNLFFLAATVLASCAAQQPPPGGPEEKTPPKVDSIFPRNRTVNVPRDMRLYFHFDRDVDEGSFATAFSITPYLNGTPKLHWSGHDEVRVELPEKLRDSTTYTVQLSRDLKSRRGNALAVPLVLSFSTGPNIDTGALAGYLLTPISAPPMKPSDLFVFAYDITVDKADTLNFTHTPPDLLTQPNDQGVWQFLAMKTGHRYRVFAIGDVYRNKVFDPGIDAFGVPSSDALPDTTVKPSIYIRMSPQTDTIRPELQDVEVVDSFHLRAHFSEAIDSNSVRALNFSLSSSTPDTAWGSGLLAAFRESPDKRPSQVTLLTTAPVLPNKNYTLTARRDSVRDLANNRLSDSSYQVTFTSPQTLREVSPPKFGTIAIRDSALDISTIPAIFITFTDAVDRDSIQRAITITDTGRKPVATRFHWYDDAKVYVSTSDSLLSNQLYTVWIRTGGIRSPNALILPTSKDTTLRFRFRTVNVRDFGKISGTITIADSFFAEPKSALVVQVTQGGTTVVAQKILPHGERSFEFDQLPTSTYRVRAYLSRDGSGTYDPGSVWPWRFGVPTGEYSTQFDTRPRWTIANIDFVVK